MSEHGPCTLNPVESDSRFESDLDMIEAGADRLLAEVGLQFEGDPDTLDMWFQFDARVSGERVYLDGAALRDVIRGQAPTRFRLRARNSLRDQIVGAGHPAVFAPVYGAPYVRRTDGVRVYGSRALYRDLVSLAHEAPALTNTGHMICAMNDVPEADRSMEMALAHLELSDKSFMGTVASPQDAESVMNAAVRAVGRERAPGECDLLHLINSDPPLTYKANPLRCLRAIAHGGQGCIVTSYMMMGATSPVTVAGALIQGYAEILAGLALTQLWSPGTPVVMGIFATAFSMRDMRPFFGDPVTQLVQLYAVGLARRLGVPVRGDGGLTSANSDDAQAGYDGARCLCASTMSGADFILHAAGWLESGLCVCMSKFKREAAAIACCLSCHAIDDLLWPVSRK